MNYNELKKIWQSEEQRAFTGWDFSYIKSRWHSEALPWDYKTIVNDHLKPSYKLLDMGTGGGEFLLSLNHPPENTSATEAWVPNVALCCERLEPLGIRVYAVSDDAKLPLSDNAFDIVLNRHTSYNLSEVSRILKPGGFFITQQVGGENNRPLSKRLTPDSTPLYPDFSLTAETPKFESHKMTIIFSNEAFNEVRFFDVGAVVYFAKIIEWEFPNFSVNRNFDQLCALQDELVTNGYISSREHRFIIIAQNTKSL